MTNGIIFGEAAAGLQPAFQAWMASKSGSGNVLLMIGAMLLVTLVVFIWAAFFRKPPRRHSHHHHHRSSERPTGNGSEPARSGRKGLFRRRHRRHKERKQNPTLAKTGGLPGIRTDNPEPPLPPV